MSITFPFPKGTNYAMGPIDQGVDIAADAHTPLLAIGDGTIISHGIGGFGQWTPVLKLDTPISGPNGQSYQYVYYGHAGPGNFVNVGTHVNAGAVIGEVGAGKVGQSTGPHLELGFSNSSGTAPIGAKGNPSAVLMHDLLTGATQTASNSSPTGGGSGSGNSAPGGGGSNSGGGGSATPAGADPNGPADFADDALPATHSWAKAAAFATFIALPDALDTQESMLLRGTKSLMNDVPLFPFIEQLAQACLRNFQSLPNGNFFAFFPDYFGGFGQRTPYWQIEDIEVIDGRIDLSDDALATHVYVVGDIVNFDGVNLYDKLQSGGVVTIENAFSTGFLDGNPFDSQSQAQGVSDTTTTISGKTDAIKFMQKYGARPYYEEAPQVRSPYYEAFLAFQRFCLLWSRQFMTTFKLTFMPELFPGGLVQFPTHGLQCYIDEVEHTCSFETGFTTQVNLSAPSAMLTGDGSPLDPTKAWIHQGMIRSFIFDDLGVGTPGKIDDSQANPLSQQSPSTIFDKITGAGTRA